MKNLLLVNVLCAFILLSNLNLRAQNQILIKLKQPPPGQLGIADLWNLSLTNTETQNIKLYLKGNAAEENSGLIIEGTTKIFTLKPGTTNYKYNDFSNAEIKYHNSKYKDIILRTGNVPEGEYTVCVTAFNENGEIVGFENCIVQTILQMGNITLILPADGDEIDSKQPLTFSWTPLPNTKKYSLKIVEILGDQPPEVAMKENRAFFEKNEIFTTVFQFPVGERKLEQGMKYGWMIFSGETKSEVNVFSLKESLLTGLITREEAIDILIKQVLVPQTLDHKVTVFLGMNITPEGSDIWPYKEKEDLRTLNAPVWFGWINDNPQAFFEHETRFVFIDAKSGKYEVINKHWWPVVNGKSLWMSEEEKETPAVLIYSDIHLTNRGGRKDE